MAAIRELLVEFGVKVNSKQLDDLSKKLSDGLQKLKAFAGPAGLLLAANALRVWTKDLLTNADALAKQSDRLGISIEELQIWQQAAGRAGASTQDINNIFRVLAKTANEASEGVATYKDAFDALGITVTDESGNLKGLNDLLLESGDALAGLENTTKRTALAQEIFGRSGLKLLPLFKDGRAGAERLLKTLKELGGGFTEEFARNAEVANDAMSDLQFVFTAFKSQIIALILPTIKNIAFFLIRMTRSINKTIKSTSLLQTIFSVGLFIGMRKALRIIIILIKQFGGFKRILLIVGKALARFALRILLPLLALDDLITFLRGGESVMGRALNALFGTKSIEKFRNFLVGTLKLIGNGIAGIFSFLKLVFSGFSADAQSEFLVATSAINKTFNGLIDELKDIWQDFDDFFAIIITAIARSFITNLVAPIANAFSAIDGIVAGVMNGINALAAIVFGSIEKRIAGMLSRLGALGRVIGNVLGIGGEPGGGRPGTATVPMGAVTSAEVNQRNQITMNINAAPGQSATTVGRAAAQAAGGQINLNTQAAFNAVVQGA